VKRLLPELRAWNQAHGSPFIYVTEASVDLADDAQLLADLVGCNFQWVFLGIETPSVESLRETLKYQNTKRPLVESVHRIQRAGLLVYGGFIVGFDADREDIFDRQIEFIRAAAIPNALIGVLVAFPGTPLYKRMQQTGRLRTSDVWHGAETGYTNIVTVLPRRTLLAGYRRLLATTYTPHEYFARAFDALARFPKPGSAAERLRRIGWLASLFLDVAVRGRTRRDRGSLLTRVRVLRKIIGELPAAYRREALSFLWAVLRRCPDQLARALPTIFMGIHYYRFTFEHVIPDLDQRLAEMEDEPDRVASVA
jgi:radical SAM superfamily enzyme YgiQ (UPF0313 family)